MMQAVRSFASSGMACLNAFTYSMHVGVEGGDECIVSRKSCASLECGWGGNIRISHVQLNHTYMRT